MRKLLPFLLQCFDPDVTSGKRIVFHVPPQRNLRGQGNQAEGEEEEEEEDQNVERQRRRDRERHNADLRRRVENINVQPATRTRLRALLASQDLENENLVERFLRHEFESEAVFNNQAEHIEQENTAWRTIFNAQRDIRLRIQELQYRVETYIEIVPRGRKEFELLLNEIRGLNRQDDGNDRRLRGELFNLVSGCPERRIAAGALTQREANQIYSMNPSQVNIPTEMARYQRQIEVGVGNIGYRRIVELKRQEADLEASFNRIYSRLNGLISQKLAHVRNAAEKQRFIETASENIGVSLRPGTEIFFHQPDILDIEGNTVRITGIRWDDIDIRDSDGNVVDRVPGTAYIQLSNGATMPIGRFRKWIDAAGGAEHIDSLDGVNTILGLTQYGIEITRGMDVSYNARALNPNADVTSNYQIVHITDIRNGEVFFSQPVLFMPGLEGVSPSEFDMRNSLSFCEFAKWWRRYQAEKSIGLADLRNFLVRYNEIENHLWELEPHENPPIMVEPGEILVFPDEAGVTYKIERLDPDGVVLETGKMSFPEFFHWVKHNHARRDKQNEKSAEQIVQEDEEERKVREYKKEQDEIKVIEYHGGLKQLEEASGEEKKHIEAGGILGALKNLWFQTEFLSLKDMKNMVMEVVEFVKRKHERRSKGHLGEAGSRLPWVLGTEFERIKQEAENGEVNKYKEAMEQWGITRVQETLHDTNSKDEAKACIMTLVHKGEMRWDDHHYWKTLNRLTARYTLLGSELYIPEIIPWGSSGEDMSRHSVDALWGEGTAAEWYGENTSKYNSLKKNYEFAFKQLENDPRSIGGPAGLLSKWLNDWKEGKYVNPQEYEEMIDAAIELGKMTAEDKMFFLISGCVATRGDDEHGETLLHLDRVGELNSKHLNRFPMLDFFTQTFVMDYSIYDSEKKRWGKSRKFQLSDYKKWVHTYFPDDFKSNKPAEQFSSFMWEYMLPQDSVRTRISKGLRNAENMDHDDAHIIVPLSTPTEIDQLTTNATGQKKYFTNEGYMNGLVGFSQWFSTLNYSIREAENEDDKKMKLNALRDSINAFIRYDLILDYRLHKAEGDRYARLDSRHYERRSVVDPALVGHHQKQLRDVILKIGKAYNIPLDFLYGKKTGSMYIKTEEEKQKQYEAQVDALKRTIEEAIDGDGGEKVLAIIQEAVNNGDTENGLRGLPASKRPDEVTSARLRKLRREYAHKAHGGGH